MKINPRSISPKRTPHLIAQHDYVDYKEHPEAFEYSVYEINDSKPDMQVRTVAKLHSAREAALMLNAYSMQKFLKSAHNSDQVMPTEFYIQMRKLITKIDSDTRRLSKDGGSAESVSEF